MVLVALLCGLGIARLLVGFQGASNLSAVLYIKVQFYTVLALAAFSDAPQRASAFGEAVA